MSAGLAPKVQEAPVVLDLGSGEYVEAGGIAPHSVIVADPRRRGRTPMLSVWCWCGRFYTVTPEEARKASAGGYRTCPDPDCGKGSE